MKKQQQLILGLGAVVLIAALSSVVTWLVVRDDGGKQAAEPSLRRGPEPLATAPPGELEKIADDKKNNPDKPRTGDKATSVGAPNPQPAGQCDPDGPPTVFAEWRSEPDSLEKAKSKAKSIVLAEVMSVEAGADIVIKNDNEPGGEIRTPTSKVTLSVSDSFKGKEKKSSTVTLFQVGNSCVRVANDPRYVKGQTELLMLEDGQQGMMQTISPEGRYRKNAQGTLDPIVDNAATEKIKGKKPEEIGSLLRG